MAYATGDEVGYELGDVRVELPVRVVLVAPAVGEPLAEPGAGHLAAELGPEAAAGVARTGNCRPLDVAQLRLHVRLQGAGESRGELHRARTGRIR